jgi:hypothetical protein
LSLFFVSEAPPARSTAHLVCRKKEDTMLNFESAGTRRRPGQFFIYAFGLMTSISVFAGNGWSAQKGDVDPHSEAEIMQALLLEVRQLRQAVEHVAAVNGRVQATLQQMQLQEQRLNRATVQLEDIRRQIEDVSSRQADLARALQNTEARLGQEVDPKRVSELEGQQADLKIMTEQLVRKESRLRAQETDADTLVQGEQNKWQDLNDQLAALTQSQGTGCSGATPKDGKQP